VVDVRHEFLAACNHHGARAQALEQCHRLFEIPGAGELGIETHATPRLRSGAAAFAF
jgi:hypothetical protein